MCEECKRLQDGVAACEREQKSAAAEKDCAEEVFGYAEERLYSAQHKRNEIQQEMKSHQDSCKDAFDDWEYHKAAVEAGQLELVK